jgi:hypothetical protein
MLKLENPIRRPVPNRLAGRGVFASDPFHRNIDLRSQPAFAGIVPHFSGMNLSQSILLDFQHFLP